MRSRPRVRGLFIGASCTCSAVLLLACAKTTGAAHESPDTPSNAVGSADTGGFPPGVWDRPELQRLVDAGLDRRTTPLLEALDDADAAVRATAANALASVQDIAARPRLTALLADPDAAVRRNAAFALGQIGDSADAAPLIAALRTETEPVVRVALFEAAGKAGGAADLVQILEHGAEDDGQAMSLALYHFGRRGVTDARAAPVLLALLHDDDGLTRMRAALALAAPRNRASWGASPRDVRAALDAMHANAREAGPLLRIIAAHDDVSDLPRLHRWLADSAHWTVRAAAAASLGAHAGAAASATTADALFAALDDRSPHVAGVAAQSLIALRTRSTITSNALDPQVWGEWIRTHLERPSVAAALLPGLVGSLQETLVFDWAAGRLGPDVPRSLAWPALARMGTAAADSILIAGLDGSRRDAYIAAALLAQRLADSPADTSLRSTLTPLVARRLAAWGPHAPGSDIRGAQRLVQQLTESTTASSRELIAIAARHPHPDIRAAAVRAGAPAATIPVAPRHPVNWSMLQSAGSRPCLVFTTKRGEFIVELYPEAAPLAASSLLEWSAAGTYDDLTFHRVEPDFILQTGDFESEHGYGGPEFGLRSEFSQLRFAPGVLGIASSGKDTEGSQFFITHNHAVSLDGRYTAVGRVIAGQDVADDVALGDPLVSVSPFERDTDTTQDERSMACTSEHT